MKVLIKVDELIDLLMSLSVVECTPKPLKADCPCCRHIVASMEKRQPCRLCDTCGQGVTLLALPTKVHS